MTLAQRLRLLTRPGLKITLDGEPAVIHDIGNDQRATVSSATQSRQWGWDNVRRVINQYGGNFRT